MGGETARIAESAASGGDSNAVWWLVVFELAVLAYLLFDGL
jgi:hypothetical protein